VPIQTVDATPTGIKLFLKVVFMKPGKRFGLSAEQKIDGWRRWKAGQTLSAITSLIGPVRFDWEDVGFRLISVAKASRNQEHNVGGFKRADSKRGRCAAH
jgi:hypothetical protein